METLPGKRSILVVLHCYRQRNFMSSCLGSLNDVRTGSWNIRFLRAFHDWELELTESHFKILYSNMPSGEGSV